MEVYGASSQGFVLRFLSWNSMHIRCPFNVRNFLQGVVGICLLQRCEMRPFNKQLIRRLRRLRGIQPGRQEDPFGEASGTGEARKIRPDHEDKYLQASSDL